MAGIACVNVAEIKRKIKGEKSKFIQKFFKKKERRKEAFYGIKDKRTSGRCQWEM